MNDKSFSRREFMQLFSGAAASTIFAGVGLDALAQDATPIATPEAPCAEDSQANGETARWSDKPGAEYDIVDYLNDEFPGLLASDHMREAITLNGEGDLATVQNLLWYIMYLDGVLNADGSAREALRGVVFTFHFEYPWIVEHLLSKPDLHDIYFYGQLLELDPDAINGKNDKYNFAFNQELTSAEWEIYFNNIMNGGFLASGSTYLDTVVGNIWVDNTLLDGSGIVVTDLGDKESIKTAVLAANSVQLLAIYNNCRVRNKYSIKRMQSRYDFVGNDTGTPQPATIVDHLAIEEKVAPGWSVRREQFRDITCVES